MGLMELWDRVVGRSGRRRLVALISAKLPFEDPIVGRRLGEKWADYKVDLRGDASIYVEPVPFPGDEPWPAIMWIRPANGGPCDVAFVSGENHRAYQIAEIEAKPARSTARYLARKSSASGGVVEKSRSN